MEPLGALFLVAALGGLAAAVDYSLRRAVGRARQRVMRVAPAPVPQPPVPGPTPGPTPTPTPTPGPTPEPEEDLRDLDTDWQDRCEWTMDSPPDAYMNMGETYVIDWPVQWAGEQEIRVWIEPPSLAEVEPTAYWEGDDLWVEVILRPKRSGWGTLMATEGTPGEQAVKGQVPWRAQCIRVETV